MPILEARPVPLGGIRAIEVRRTLPHRERTTVGPWIFCDHYGPTNTPMDVPPHPHTGLATVSWLFSGEIRHDDTAGNHAQVLPGELNMMTAGDGIAHTEVSQSEWIHGVQLWLAYPKAQRGLARRLQHYAPEPVCIGAATVLLFLGSLHGAPSSPVDAPKRALGAEIRLPKSENVALPLDSTLEYAVLADTEPLEVNGERVEPGNLWYADAGLEHLQITNLGADTRCIILGGEPFGESVVMFWNFVGTDHAEVAQQRADWEDPAARAVRFGNVAGYPGAGKRIPAPPLPGVLLRPRANRRKR
ncbi:pirin family protein [Corynebacterium sp.]|uniref:pirin family protein n=1 Tax=Corynebacterium sp. TaxID=1720 RepID=UPI0026DAC24F|nr:pirin family protein [Corynebacterium sp.]MDO5076865.1 pirin family protein [Corynebacterium sp.]